MRGPPEEEGWGSNGPFESRRGSLPGHSWGPKAAAISPHTPFLRPSLTLPARSHSPRSSFRLGGRVRVRGGPGRDLPHGQAGPGNRGGAEVLDLGRPDLSELPSSPP